MLKHKITTLILLITSLAIARADSQALYLQPGALDFVGVYSLRELDPNLTGQNIIIAEITRSMTYTDGFPQNDFAVNTKHPCFVNSNIEHFGLPEIPMGLSKHATAVASILLGDNKGSLEPQFGSFYHEGATPKAKLNVYEFWNFLQNYIYPNQIPDVDVITISYGSTYQDWWTRGFEHLAEYGITIVAGIGNGTNAYDPILYPGGSPNIIGVGVADSVIDPNFQIALSNFGLPRSEHSSIGPAKTGIAKPDIVAPGNCIVADTNDGYTISGNYSSFSTPIVAGTAALLTQTLKQKYAETIDPNYYSVLIKSILLTTADKLPYWHKGQPQTDDDNYVPLDYIQGAGMLNALSAVEVLQSSEPNKAGFAVNIADANLTKTYKINASALDNDLITATLVWNNHYQKSYPYNLIKQTNLRLELWAIDTNDPNKDQLIDFSDSAYDNIEHIYIPASADFNDYELVVMYSDPNETHDTEPFAISWNIQPKLTIDSVLLYDLTNDGIVNNQDFITLINNIGKQTQAPASYHLGDTDMNGQIDINDLTQIMQRTGLKAHWKQ
jgi:hypothetical protein